LASHLRGWLLGELSVRSRQIVTADERRVGQRRSRAVEPLIVGGKKAAPETCPGALSEPARLLDRQRGW
jgi:hypothetical protein